MNPVDLMVVMPVYNEAESIEKVLTDWVSDLTKLDCSWKLLVIDDGSSDKSYELMQKLKTQLSADMLTTSNLQTEMKSSPSHSYNSSRGQIEVLTQSNMGHGQTCIKGYQMSIAQNAAWTLQIDSDGQCDPQYLQEFWNKRSSEAAVLGYRKTRDDGFARWLISRVVSLVLFLGLGSWVKDANVPYRLIPLSLLRKIVENVPSDFQLVNILLSGRIQKLKPIRWIPIHFLDRHGGTPSVKAYSFAKHGVKLLIQLWRA